MGRLAARRSTIRLLALLLAGLIAGRAVLEERTLQKELQGYDAYMAQVKYRLIPHVW